MTNRFRVLSSTCCPYFITCTTIDWLPIFSDQAYIQIVLDALAYLRQHKYTQLNAFVIMPSHLHAILWPDDGINLSDVLRDFKRHTSRTISKAAVTRRESELLAKFAAARQRNRAQEVSSYQVWQEGSHPEAILSTEFARQKLDYIHNNPIRAGLATEAEGWPFSSAGTYYGGKVTYPPVDILALM